MKKHELKQIIKEELLAELEPISNAPVSAKEMLNKIVKADYDSGLNIANLYYRRNFKDWYEDYNDEANEKEIACAKLFFKLRDSYQIYVIEVSDEDNGLINFPKAYSFCYWIGDGDNHVILMFHNIK